MHTWSDIWFLWWAKANKEILPSAFQEWFHVLNSENFAIADNCNEWQDIKLTLSLTRKEKSLFQVIGANTKHSKILNLFLVSCNIRKWPIFCLELYLSPSVSAELIDWTFPGPVVLSLDPGHRKSRFQKWWGGSSEAFRVAVEFIWASSSGAELIWFKLSSSNQPSWIRLQPLISSWLLSLAGVIWPVAANHLLKKRQSVLSWSCWVWQFFVLCFPGWCLAWQFMELIHCSTGPSLL